MPEVRNEPVPIDVPMQEEDPTFQYPRTPPDGSLPILPDPIPPASVND